MAEQISGEKHKELLAQKSHKTERKISNNHLMYAGIGTILLVVMSFMAGMQYQKGLPSSSMANQPSSNGSGTQTSPFAGGFGGRNGRRGGALGQVTAISSTSISVQNSRTNATNTLDITSDTKVTNGGQASSVSNIKVGDSVIVLPNSSNTKQAAQIIVNPQMMGPGNSGLSAPTSGQSNTNNQLQTN